MSSVEDTGVSKPSGGGGAEQAKPSQQRRARGGPDEKLSRAMSRVLRHGLKNHGLESVVRPNGFVPLRLLLSCGALPRATTAADVHRVVSTCSKQRFAITTDGDAGGELLVRANQGHSVGGALLNDEEMLRQLTAAELASMASAVHGTYYAAWPDIVKTGGLNPMKRRHVHMAQAMPGAAGVISGMRRSCEVYVWVDLVRAAERGCKFYASANGVILTAGVDGVVPLDCFERVEDHSGRIWRDGCWD